MKVYMPREDTELIKKYVQEFCRGNVLDMGTGSGELAIAAAHHKDVNQVIAVDINKNALIFAHSRAKEMGVGNIQFIHSDLFESLKGRTIKFDVILFNPPYLPFEESEPEEIRLQTTGGKHGYELIERFFRDVSGFLMPYGQILLVFSSLTGKEKVHEIIEDCGFNYQKLAEENFFQESIYLYLIEKSKVLTYLEAKGIQDVHKFAKGHRGIIFKAEWKGTPVAIKVKNPDSAAIGRIINEARWLKVLNMKGIGPKLLFHNDALFCYEFIEGEFIEPFFAKEATTKTQIKKMVKEVFKQCYAIDLMNVNKEEMHNPYKHVIINENAEPFMVDFERMHVTDKPKNVTQFSQYIISGKITKMLEKKGIKIRRDYMISACRHYKDESTKANFDKILRLI